MENNTPLLERLERVIDTLSDNSVKMGQMLAVHDEKLDKQDRIDAVLFEKIESLHRELNRSTDEIKKGCERDIRLVDNRLRMMEKKMWSIFGPASSTKMWLSRPLMTTLTPRPSILAFNLPSRRRVSCPNPPFRRISMPPHLTKLTPVFLRPSPT